MTNVLIRKLELFGALPEDDRRLLADVVVRTRDIPRHHDIAREGDSTQDVHLILQGFACRYKMLANGRRQILAYLIPGDFCDLHVFILNRMDHSIGTLSECKVVDIPRADVLQLTTRPAIARALWWASLVDEATLREWLLNIGQRGATERVAHLFCEIHLRLKSVGLADGGRFTLPITQVELADTIGVSSVHTNRALQELRGEELITFKSRQVVLLDLERLRQKSGFDPNYLHLEGGKHDRPPNDS